MKKNAFVWKKTFPNTTSGLFRTALIASAITLTGLSNLAFASFEARDAEQVDRELMSAEFYLDAFSYRYTLGLENTLLNRDALYATSFGSLDGKHFYRLEDIKIQKKHKDTTFAYVSHREEDLIEKRLHSEFRLSQQLHENFGMLAKFSSDFYKKWCDIGMGIEGFSDGKKRYGLEVSMIDSFYNMKEENPNDRYLKKVWNFKSSLSPIKDDSSEVTLSGELDTPVNWKRPSEGYVYTFRQESAALLTSHWLTEHNKIWLNTTYEHKQEAKEFTNEIDNSRSLDQREQRLSLYRHDLDTRLGWLNKSTESESTHEFTVGHYLLDADYDAVQASQFVRNAPPAKTAPALSGKLRNFSASQLNDLQFAEEHFFRTGASAAWSFTRSESETLDRKERVEDKIAAKFHTGWEYRLGKHGVFGFHITWDLDNWTRKAFRGENYNSDWDGGNAQFSVAL